MISVFENAHADIIRGFCTYSNSCGFATCSNDTTVKTWAFDLGTSAISQVGEGRVHSGFVFSISKLTDNVSDGAEVGSSSSLVSGGDDRLLVVWDADSMASRQKILHVGTVWATAELKGDKKLHVNSC